MVTTTNLNQGSDFFINSSQVVQSPIGADSNQFISIQKTFSESIDYDFVYDGLCSDISFYINKYSVATLQDCRNECILHVTCEYYYFQSTDGQCYVGSGYCSPQVSSTFKYYKLHQWSKNIWKSDFFIYQNVKSSFNQNPLDISLCESLSPMASDGNLSAGTHFFPLSESISISQPFKFGCSTPIRYLLIKNMETSITDYNVEISWTSDELVQTPGNLTIGNISQSTNQVQIFSVGVLFGFPGSHNLDQHQITPWEIIIDRNLFNCSQNLQVFQVENSDYDNKEMTRTAYQQSRDFNNLKYPLPFEFVEDEMTCDYSISYGLSKTRNIYTPLNFYRRTYTNSKLTKYPGILSLGISSQYTDSLNFAFYVEIQYTQGRNQPYKIVANYSFLYIIKSRIKVPQWSSEWDHTINLDLLVDEDDNLIENQFWIWTSPTLINVNPLDPVLIIRRTRNIRRRDNKIITQCGRSFWNKDYSFTIQLDKQCIENEGEGVYGANVKYRFKSTPYYLSTRAIYDVVVRKVKQEQNLNVTQDNQFFDEAPKQKNETSKNFVFQIVEKLVNQSNEIIIEVETIETNLVEPEHNQTEKSNETANAEEIKSDTINIAHNLIIQTKIKLVQSFAKEKNGWIPPTKPDSLNFTSRIYAISALAKVQIVFNASMNPANISNYNSDNILIYLDKYNPKSRKYDTILLNMNWEAIEFKNYELSLQINFSSALNVSQEEVPDELVVVILNNSMFYSASVDNFLVTYIMRKPIRRQMPNTPTNQNIVSSTELSERTMKLLFGISIFMTLVFQKGGIDYYLLMTQTLQIILHLPIYLIQAPANISMLCSVLIPVANFDFNIDSFLKKLFYFSELEIDSFPLSFELIGYGHNAVLNMGSIFVANILQNILIVVLVTLIVTGMAKEFKAVQFHIKVELFQIFPQIYEIYLEYLISGILSAIIFPIFTPHGELLSLIYSYQCSVYALVLLPIFIIYTLVISRERFQDKDFMKTTGAIYELVKTTGDWEMRYYVFFILRRFLYVLIAFKLKYQSLQLIFWLYLNMMLIIYIGRTKPKKERLINRLELFNEFMNQLICFHQFYFTQFCPDIEMQFNIGWSQMAFIMLFIIINLSLIAYNGFLKFRIICIKYVNLFKFKCKKQKENFELQEVSFKKTLKSYEINTMDVFQTNTKIKQITQKDKNTNLREEEDVVQELKENKFSFGNVDIVDIPHYDNFIASKPSYNAINELLKQQQDLRTKLRDVQYSESKLPARLRSFKENNYCIIAKSFQLQIEMNQREIAKLRKPSIQINHLEKKNLKQYNNKLKNFQENHEDPELESKSQFMKIQVQQQQVDEFSFNNN